MRRTHTRRPSDVRCSLSPPPLLPPALHGRRPHAPVAQNKHVRARACWRQLTQSDAVLRCARRTTHVKVADILQDVYVFKGTFAIVGRIYAPINVLYD